MNTEKEQKEEITSPPSSIEKTSDQIKAELDAFLADPEKKKEAIQLAHQILTAKGNKWFTTKQLVQSFRISEEAAKIRLLTLTAFGLAAFKTKGDKRLYKIDLDQRTQRQLITEDIAFHEGQIVKLKEKLVRLN
jgi:hypothetical protein